MLDCLLHLWFIVSVCSPDVIMVKDDDVLYIYINFKLLKIFFILYVTFRLQFRLHKQLAQNQLFF